MIRKFIVLPVLFFLVTPFGNLAAQEEAIDPGRAANTVILDDVAVKNLGIQLVEVAEVDFEETVFSIGRIEEIPSRHSVLSSRIPGRIVEVNAIEGDEVKAGDVLVTVESRQPGDPPPTIPLPAPISGLVTESHVRLGEPVEPDREMFDIVDLSEVWAVAAVPEQEAGKLALGCRARIRVMALTGGDFEGELVRFGTSADREAGTLDAIFRLSNPDNLLRPGMRAEFSIVVGSREKVMAVPEAAIQGDVASRVVYVKDFDLPNAFVKVPVQTGAKNDRYVEIKRGLFPGDEVVTTGAYFLGFAGGGGISLKEALDAAHGHEHNEDGSEMTAEDRARKEREAAAAGGGGGAPVFLTIFFGATSVLLLAILILGTLARRTKSHPKVSEPSPGQG